MARKIPNPRKGTCGSRRGGQSFYTTLTIGASGAISTQDKSEDSGFAQVVKTAATTGRYTFTLPERYKKFLKGVVTVIGPNTANYGANTTGLGNFWRANDIDGNNKDGTIELQFVQASYADAEVPSGVILLIELEVAEGI